MTRAIAILGLALLAVSVYAQDPPRVPGAPPPVVKSVFDGGATTIPFFPLVDSPLALAGPARPGMFMSAVGRKAIAMGTEDGSLELWSWPIKWLHDFELLFKVPKYTAAIPGRSVAHSVIQRPEGITIEYAHEQFTVRQHVFVPLNEPAVIMLLEVDAIRPLDIIVRFAADIHYAWPAGLGGQYLVWEQNARAFLFSEGKQAVNAFLGSPAVTQASDVLAHMLAAERPQFVLAVGGETERYTAPRLGEPPGKNVNIRAAYIPIVLAGGQMPRDQALELYRRLSAPGAAEQEWKRRVEHADAIRDTMLSLKSPDPMLNTAVEYAKVNLDESMVCNPDLGCGLVAGYGLSGAASDRPGFGWFFGGDAAINSFAMTGVGLAPLVRDGVLQFFAKYQRTDGKITHEISQGAGRVDWFNYPYPYYHGDTTPFWILAAGEYWRQTGDIDTIKALWPNLKRAFDWSRATDIDGDGLMENPAAGAGALEVGDLQIGILSDVYLSGVWVSSLDRFAAMARALGEPSLSDSAGAIRTKALKTMESRLWMAGPKQYAFALLKDGSVNDNLTAWPATAMSFDALDPVNGAEMAARLASSAIMTDWGARPLGSASTLFDPLHYNNGAVWPFVTGFVSLGQYKYHNAPAGFFALQAIARTGFDQALGRNPELFSGRFYKPLDTAVPQQFFATSMVLTPLIRGLFGIDVNVPDRRITIAPHLPPDWDSAELQNVPVGSGKLSIAFKRTAGRITATVRRSGDRTPLEVVFSPALPLGARVSGSGVVTLTPGDMHATVRAMVMDAADLSVAYTGGWSVSVPSAPPRIGQRSQAMRVISERLDSAGSYVVAFEGIAGRSHSFTLKTPAGDRTETVTFPATGANADGYSARTLTFR